MKKIILTLISLIILASASGSIFASDAIRDEKQHLHARINGEQHLSTEEASFNEGVKVAVIDNGFDLTHPLLSQHIDGGANVRDFTTDVQASKSRDPKSAEVYGKIALHGTHVAGIIAQLVPSTVRIFPYKIGAPGNRQGGEEIKAIDHLINYDNDVQICNISLAILFRYAGEDEVLKKILKLSKKMLIVVSAGNSSWTYSDTKRYEGILELLQMANGNIIVVGASKYDHLQQRERFDDEYSDRAGNIREYFITAPGSKIRSSIPLERNEGGFRELDGTSMAAPVVVGALANIMSRTGVSFTEARNAIFDTARAPDTEGCGVGYFDFDAAYIKARDTKYGCFWERESFFKDYASSVIEQLNTIARTDHTPHSRQEGVERMLTLFKEANTLYLEQLDILLKGRKDKVTVYDVKEWLASREAYDLKVQIAAEKARRGIIETTTR